MQRKPVVVIDSPAKWKALLSPARSEIMQGLRCIGPCSVAELAAMIDRPADTLYRHLDVLQRAGFVERTGERKRSRHTEQLVDVTGSDFAIGFGQPGDAKSDETLHATSKAFLRSTARTVRDALKAGQLTVQPSTLRNFVLNYDVAWLTPERFRQVRGLVKQLKDIMDEGNAERHGRLYVTLTVSSPLVRRPRPSRKPKAPSTSTPRRARSSRS